VVEVAQRPEAEFDETVRAAAVQVHDEGDAARVVFERRVVETLPRREVVHVVVVPR
jgi:hypothetical protein